MTLKRLYDISEVKVSGTAFFASISFNPEHPVFNGHFPGQPVVPGVVLIRILKMIVADITGKNMILDHSGNIKFLNVIDPRDRNIILCKGSIDLSEKDHYAVNASLSNQSTVYFKFKGNFRNS